METAKPIINSPYDQMERPQKWNGRIRPEPKLWKSKCRICIGCKPSKAIKIIYTLSGTLRDISINRWIGHRNCAFLLY